MSNKLKAQIAKESISVGKKVKSLSRSAVARDQWKTEREYQLAFESDANQTALLARQSTQRQLLSYKIFPEPKDTSTLIFDEFGRQYRSMINKLIARVNASDCPTIAELKRSLKGSGLSVRTLDTRESVGTLSEVNATIRDALCRMKAESASAYINPADLDGYEFWGKYEYAGMSKAVEDCWYWQLAHWVIEDVIDTIAACNAGSNSVFTSPAKRLMTVSLTGGETTRRARGGNRPDYVRSAQDGLTEPCTGRSSNDDIDVVHFNAVVVVSTKAVLPFMRQFCSAKQHRFKGFFGNAQEQIFKHNQITILESSIEPINQEDATHILYRYGEDTVVQLDLICEYIFNKNGYDEIKPESIK